MSEAAASRTKYDFYLLKISQTRNTTRPTWEAVSTCLGTHAQAYLGRSELQVIENAAIMRKERLLIYDYIVLMG